jgi:hypothetical protein
MAKNETSTPSTVSLPIPKILRMSLVGKGQMAGRIGTSFKPPSSMRDWPATIRDIDDSFLKKVINIGYRSGPAPVGSIYNPSLSTPKLTKIVEIDGHVYTDDFPFWFSIAKSEGIYNIVYGTLYFC